MPWGAVAGAAIGLIGSSMSADAASDASDAQVNSSRESVAEQRRQYDLTRSDQKQFLDTGKSANRKLAQLLGIGPAPNTSGEYRLPTYADILSYNQGVGSPSADQDTAHQYAQIMRGEMGSAKDVYDRYKAAGFEFGHVAPGGGDPGSSGGGYGDLLRKFTMADRDADPVYRSGLEFGLNQGTQGINNRAIATGNYDSGATLKALTRFGNDYGSTKANESYNRFTQDQSNIYNKLAGVSGAGQVAANQVGAAGQNSANNISNLMTGEGNARAAGIVGGANAWAGGMQNAYNNYNNYNQQQMLKQLFNNSNQGYNTDGRDY